MRVEDFVLPNSIEDWVSLRKEIRREFHYQHSQGSMTLVILLMSSHVMSMILFMVSAIKHSRTKDSTTSIIDSEGYIRPRMHTTTPVLVAIYCTIAFLALGSFLHELNVCTASLHMVSISFGLIMAWEQVILTAYAMPSRKYRFQTMSWSPRSRKIERHILTPNQFNFIIIAGVLFPFVVPVSSGIPAIKSFARANAQWKVFDTNCHDFIHFLKNTSVPLDSTNNILKNTKETQMLLQLLELSKLGDKIAVYNRWTGGLYFFVAFIQTFMGSILQISILRCLFSRLKVLRDRCIQWQKLRLELPVSNSEVSFSIFKESIHGGQDNGTIDLKDRPVESWTDWLPRYTSASGNGSQSISHPIDEKDLFEGTSDGRTLQQQYIITRVYTINFTWVAVLMLFAMLSTMLCALASALNWYDSPKKRTYLQALVFQIMWTNATWGGGSGILQGILKIMITSSPVPVLPREPSAAPITHSDEE